MRRPLAILCLIPLLACAQPAEEPAAESAAAHEEDAEMSIEERLARYAPTELAAELPTVGALDG